MKIYIAGPMSGLKAFNFHAFDAAAEHLFAIGHEVISPAELDAPEFRERVMGANGTEKDLLGEWGNCLARDVKLITDDGVEALALLPGWWKSRGANLEAVVGLLNGLKFFQYQADERDPLAPISKMSVLSGIVKGFQHRWEKH